MEEITRIEYLVNQTWGNEREYFEGYIIETTRQQIRVFISDFCACCEEFGVALLTPTDSDIVGAKVMSVGWGNKIDNTLHTKDAHGVDIFHVDSSSGGRDVHYAVVDVVTDQGLMQLVAYNEHEGYYPHVVCVSWKDYTDVQEL